MMAASLYHLGKHLVLVYCDVYLETERYEHSKVVARYNSPVRQSIGGLSIPTCLASSSFITARLNLIRHKNCVLPNRNKKPQKHDCCALRLDLGVVIDMSNFVDHPEQSEQEDKVDRVEAKHVNGLEYCKTGVCLHYSVMAILIY